MPVKWDAAKDSFILNHLLTDPRCKIDTTMIDSMIAAWPSDFGPAPTRKAFTEHFLKIRKANKDHSPSPAASSAASSKTPKTPKTTKTNGRAKGKGGSAKGKGSALKRQMGFTDSDDEEGNEIPTPSKKPRRGGKAVNYEMSENEDEAKNNEKDSDEHDSETAACAPEVKAEPTESEDDVEV